MARVFIKDARHNWTSKDAPRRDPNFWDELDNCYKATLDHGVLSIFNNTITEECDLFKRLGEFEKSLRDAKPGSLQYQSVIAEFKEYAKIEVQKAPVGFYELNDEVWGILYTRQGQVKFNRGARNNAQQRVLWRITLESLADHVKARGGRIFGTYNERMRAALKKARRSC